MEKPFIGSEAVAAGIAPHAEVRCSCARVFHDVYVSAGTELTPELRARAAWLWSRRRGVVAGFSAAALYGSTWVGSTEPAELIHDNRQRLPGLIVRGDRSETDEIQRFAGVAITTPARTALDLACWNPTTIAVAAIDALAQAVDVKMADVDLLAQRYPGRRGISRARKSLDLADVRAQSPKESWLRIVLIEAGFPRPQTQIPIYSDFGEIIAYLDLGWEQQKIAVEYDGEQHRSDRRQYTWDIRRLETLERLGWTVIRG